MNRNSSEIMSTTSQDVQRAYWFAISLILGASGQFAITQAKAKPTFWEVRNIIPGLGNNSSPLLGLILYGFATTLFIFSIRKFNPKQKDFILAIKEQTSHPVRFGFWVTSLGLSGITGYFASQYTPASSVIGFEIVSLISLYMFVISLYFEEKWTFLSPRDIPVWVSRHKSELVVLLTILFVAFIIRFADLELHPYSFINDEGEMGVRGVCLLQGRCTGLMDTEWSQQPMLAFLPTGVSVWLFGNTALAVRLVSVIIGTLAVLMVYLLTREIFDTRSAWVAALILATLPVNVHFSRLGVDNIVDSLSTTTILWLLLRGFKRNSTSYFLTAGIIGGLCFYTYPGSRLAPFFGLLAAGIMGLKIKGFFQSNSRYILIFLLAIFITAAPILGFFISHPANFTTRMNTEGIFTNHSLQGEMQANNYGASQVLLRQFLKSSLVFIVSDAPGNFFNSPRPYLAPITAIFFIFGLAYTTWRMKDPRYFILFFWFWGPVILGSTITGGPPTSQRMLMSTPALAIITTLGISKFSDFVPKSIRWSNYLPSIILLFFVLYNGSQDINYYFGKYRIGHYFEDPTNEFTYETRSFISPLGQKGRLYLIAEPDIPYLTFASLDFFSPGVEKTYFPHEDIPALENLPHDKDALFIATPAFKTELESISNTIPGGEWHTVYRRYQVDQVLFYSYQVSKQQVQLLKP